MKIILRHATQNVGVMMLNFNQRNLQLGRNFFGKRGRLIARVKVASHDFGRNFQQIFHALNRFLQNLNRSQVANVADIGRGIKQIILREAKSILEFAADSQDGFFIRVAENWKGRITATAPNH